LGLDEKVTGEHVSIVFDDQVVPAPLGKRAIGDRKTDVCTEHGVKVPDGCGGNALMHI
jgi:hypothetical protein